jgi:proprotein convertase subtilisin/kexin type 6
LREAERLDLKALFFSVSHLYGFGLVDAEALVLEARKWTAVPSQHVCVATADKRPR